MNHQKPTILYENIHTIDDLRRLRRTTRIWKERDLYEMQLVELFEVTHPHLHGSPTLKMESSAFVQRMSAQQHTKIMGSWVFYPWNGILLHTLTEHDLYLVRTNRNRNIITRDEQEILRNFTVGMVGLSVGSNIATALLYAGIGKMIKLAEFDTLETTNLNRIRARIDQVGQQKIDITAQQIYEVNPFSEIVFCDSGIDKHTLAQFVNEDPRPKLIFEVIDSFEMKIHLRALAREERIPVIMITNLGDRVIIDLERYDIDPKTTYFNNRAGNVPNDMLDRPDISEADKHRYAVDLAGVERIPKRALESVAEIGKTLVGRPQLTSTVTMAAAFSSYLTRKIALGENLPSVSWLIDLDKVFSIENAL